MKDEPATSKIVGYARVSKTDQSFNPATCSGPGALVAMKSIRTR